MENAFSFNEVLTNYYDPDTIIKMSQLSIGIAGAGGIGSNCAQLLVRSGLSAFVIADFDNISASNLNRQAFNISQIGKSKVTCLRENCCAINPDVLLTTHHIRVERSNIHTLFDGCDVIIEAFDDPAAKALLFGEYLPSKKLLIGASGIAGIGKSDTIGIRKIREHCFIVGDETSAVGATLQPYAPRVMIVAATMANLVLEWAVTSRYPVQ